MFLLKYFIRNNENDTEYQRQHTEKHRTQILLEHDAVTSLQSPRLP